MHLASLPCGLMDDLLGLEVPDGMDGLRYTGIDIDRESLIFTENNARARGCRIALDLRQADVMQMPTHPEFDLVTSNGLNIYLQSDEECVAFYRQTAGLLNPGGHLLAFGGTRTYHRMACAIEDAGFEVRDSLHWIYGSGFPKSLDVSKAIDKAAGAEREVIGANPYNARRPNPPESDLYRQGGWAGDITAPATDAARQWEGWGTALKPAHEPVVVARKPLVGTVAANVQEHGTGALNISGSRVGTNGGTRKSGPPSMIAGNSLAGSVSGVFNGGGCEPINAGRWPPNILLSHTPECEFAGMKRVKAAKNNGSISRPGVNVYGDYAGDRPAFDYADADGMETVESWKCAELCPVAEMDRQSGIKTGKGTQTIGGPPRSKSAHIQQMSEQPRTDAVMDYGDSGGASRFFPVFRYQAKASRSERERGLHEGQKASHPTVKPVALMRWLVRLVTPPGGVVLDPFMGSGTTGVAALEEGFAFVGVERELEYFRICEARIGGVEVDVPAQKEMFG